MTDHDCGHTCCDERGDPYHDHFLAADICPPCVMSRRTIARLFRQDDGLGHFTDEAVQRLVGQEPSALADNDNLGRVRIVKAWIEDGWVVVEMEPVDADT